MWRRVVVSKYGEDEWGWSPTKFLGAGCPIVVQYIKGGDESHVCKVLFCKGGFAGLEKGTKFIVGLMIGWERVLY